MQIILFSDEFRKNNKEHFPSCSAGMLLQKECCSCKSTHKRREREEGEEYVMSHSQVVKTPVSLLLCRSPLTATRYTVYSVPGCRFLSRYLVAEGPTL